MHGWARLPATINSRAGHGAHRGSWLEIRSTSPSNFGTSLSWPSPPSCSYGECPNCRVGAHARREPHVGRRGAPRAEEMSLTVRAPACKPALPGKVPLLAHGRSDRSSRPALYPNAEARGRESRSALLSSFLEGRDVLRPQSPPSPTHGEARQLRLASSLDVPTSSTSQVKMRLTEHGDNLESEQ